MSVRSNDTYITLNAVIRFLMRIQLISKSEACRMIGQHIGYAEKTVMKYANGSALPSYLFYKRLSKYWRSIQIQNDKRPSPIRMTNDPDLAKEFIHLFPTIEQRDQFLRNNLSTSYTPIKDNTDLHN